MDTLVLRRPDDWHVHLRDGAALRDVLPWTARAFGRAMVMPNLAPPVATVEAGLAYRDRVLAALPPGARFTPLFAAYLTDATSPVELERGFRAGVFAAAKLYPAHATTHAEAGVTDVRRLGPVFERMAEVGLPLLVHGEVVGRDVDVFDREAVFVERVLAPLVAAFPALQVVLEHVTTKEGVDFVLGAGDRVAATVTAHHLVLDRTAMFDGGLRPHHYCLPVPKREHHRLALRRAATSGHPRFFLGTDSAPHPVEAKESARGCAGLFTAPTALELYATVFEEEGRLDRLEAFASEHGARFYGLPPSEERVTLVREAWTVPERLPLGSSEVVPFPAGQPLRWRLAPA